MLSRYINNIHDDLIVDEPLIVQSFRLTKGLLRTVHLVFANH